jgi:hypothetical protein
MVRGFFCCLMGSVVMLSMRTAILQLKKNTTVTPERLLAGD